MEHFRREEGVEFLVKVWVLQVVFLDEVEDAVQSQQADRSSNVVRLHQEVRQEERFGEVRQNPVVQDHQDPFDSGLFFGTF